MDDLPIRSPLRGTWFRSKCPACGEQFRRKNAYEGHYLGHAADALRRKMMKRIFVRMDVMIPAMDSDDAQRTLQAIWSKGCDALGYSFMLKKGE
jgi:uncharacterized C2H2 Zn-finger protein